MGDGNSIDGDEADVSRANDGEVAIRRRYGAAGSAALERWAAETAREEGPYRPRFMVYSGLGTPAMTAQRLAILQDLGAESFLLAADLPSQLGFDPDHELAHAQVGRAGVSCATLADFGEICAGIDLKRAESLGLLANSVGHIGLGMVHCVLSDAGAQHVRLVMQNDPLKEFTARGTEIFTPEQAVRIACDCVAFAIDQSLPGAAITVCSNHLDVAGAGPVVATAIAFANACVYLDELVRRGYAIEAVLPHLMFFLNERSDLFVGAALFRTARTVWSEIVAQRYGLPVERQPVMPLMGYAHGLESADEPMVNVPRITLSVLAAMLGGVDYLCASAYDEALRIPSVDAAALALRTMQVVAYEHGATSSVDALAGSHKLTELDEQIAAGIRSELARLAEHGGGLGALHDGYVSSRIDELRGTRQRQLATGERAMVGSNLLRSPWGPKLLAGRSSGEVDFAAVERAARARIAAHRGDRDGVATRRALEAVQVAAAGTDNLLPPTIAALRAGATTQEIVGATGRGFAQ
jgi:methylmalonyl-CoA mutase N-terminal domain/subunit